MPCGPRCSLRADGGFSPEYELKFLALEDYANGGLDGLDLVIQPGGGCTKQYNALGEKGAGALMVKPALWYLDLISKVCARGPHGK